MNCDCLDRETESVYYLNVLATDEGGLTDVCQLIISIADVNDKAPVFNPDVFYGFINESSTTFFSEINIQV